MSGGMGMHEYPVTLEIVRIAEKTAREKGGLVKAIHLVVGLNEIGRASCRERV